MHTFEPYMWQCGNKKLSLDRPRIMGVVNVTPDSFSDGGDHADPEAALKYALELLDQGADIIDVGGESTRPGFTPVSCEEELRRVVPVVKGLVEAGAIVSIDTRHAEVARECVRLGVSIINDVTGFQDPAMVEVAANSAAGLIVMHAGEVGVVSNRKSVDLDQVMQRSASGYTNKNQAEHKSVLPEESEIMRSIVGVISDSCKRLEKAGVNPQRICVDPGPGFGKTADQDIVIQKALGKLCKMGYPVLCAVSRKRFVGVLSGATKAKDRDSATSAICINALNKGARIFRVHNVLETARALRSYSGLALDIERSAYIALGSSVGDRKNNLVKAIQEITELPMTYVKATSKAYESEGAYGLAGLVANAVIEVKTELDPMVLLDNLLAIEDKLGRVRPQGSNHNAPRTIDLDLIWMDHEIHAGRKLTLPHPRLAERDFVLYPLGDILTDPERFFTCEGMDVLPRENRYGKVVSCLGDIAWQK